MAVVMTESLMLVALGFLVAALISIMIMRLVWRRAVTVTARKLAPLEETRAAAPDQPPEPRPSHPVSETRVAALEAALADAEAALASAITHQDTAARQDRNAQEEISELHAQIDALVDDRDRIAKEFEAEKKYRLKWQAHLDDLTHNARALVDLLDEAAAPLNAVPQPTPAAPAERPAGPGMPQEAPANVPSEQEAITSSLLRFNDNVKQRFGHPPPSQETDVAAPDGNAEARKPKEKTLSARIRALQKGIRP